MMKILFTGGGTGGHLMPIIAISRELKKINPELIKLYYVGPADKKTKTFLKSEGFMIKKIIAGKIRRYFSVSNALDILFKIPLSFLQSFFLILFIRPKIVFSKGGTSSLPVAWVAKLFRIPVFIHESDVSPGLSNRIVSKWAKKIFTSFDKTEFFDQNRVIVVGNPIRRQLLEKDDKDPKKEMEILSDKPVILFLGGSQGARFINDSLMLILNDLLKKYEVIHVTGPLNYKKCKAESEVILDKELQSYYHLLESLEELELKYAYSTANLVISRAGSGSIFEIAAFGKPSILIPLPSSASNHQFKNAYQYSRNGSAIVMEQDNITPNLFLGQIEFIISSERKSEEMKRAALDFAKPKAAENIAKEIISYLGLPQSNNPTIYT